MRTPLEIDFEGMSARPYSRKSNNNAPFQVDFGSRGGRSFLEINGKKGGSFDAHQVALNVEASDSREAPMGGGVYRRDG
jgi:hypothetical protein